MTVCWPPPLVIGDPRTRDKHSNAMTPCLIITKTWVTLLHLHFQPPTLPSLVFQKSLLAATYARPYSVKRNNYSSVHCTYADYQSHRVRCTQRRLTQKANQCYRYNYYLPTIDSSDSTNACNKLQPVVFLILILWAYKLKSYNSWCRQYNKNGIKHYFFRFARRHVAVECWEVCSYTR